MAQTPYSVGLAQPLNAGNVVSAALVIYRSRLNDYLSVAWRATLWSLVPVLLVIPIAIPFIQAIRYRTPTPLLSLLLLIPIWLVATIFCSARYLFNGGLICRLAYGDLVALPETVKASRRKLQTKTWWFLLTQILVNLILSAINFALQFVNFGLGIVSAIARDNQVITGLVGFILFLVYLGAYLWLYSRFFVPEVPLAVEEGSDGVSAISRSWTLTSGSVLRIQLIIFVAFLVTTPLYGLALIPASILFVNYIPRLTNLDSSAIGAMVVFAVLATLLILGVNLLVMPFWQVIKAVVYYDLRSRREGLGLKLSTPAEPVFPDTSDVVSDTLTDSTHADSPPHEPDV